MKIVLNNILGNGVNNVQLKFDTRYNTLNLKFCIRQIGATLVVNNWRHLGCQHREFNGCDSIAHSRAINDMLWK